MRIILLFIISVFSLSINSNEISENNKQAELILEKVIYDLQKKEYITNKTAKEALADYKKENNFIKELDVLIKESNSNIVYIEKEDSSWTKHITLMNIIKLIGIILILIAIRGILFKIIKSILFIILAVPLFVYQASFLFIGIFATYFSDYIWQEEAFYLSLFGSILNLIVVAWIFHTYEYIVRVLDEFFNKFKISLSVFLLTIISIYYYQLSLSDESMIFGTLSVFSFLGLILNLTMLIFEKMKTEFKFLYIYASLNITILIAYVLLSINDITYQYMYTLSFGIEYLTTIVILISLFILSSPFIRDGKGLVATIMTICISAFCLIFDSSYGFESIIGLFNTLLLVIMLQWIFYVIKNLSYIIVCFVSGVLLFVSGKLIESNNHLFFTNLL
jgi:hypothetical protein